MARVKYKLTFTGVVSVITPSLQIGELNSPAPRTKPMSQHHCENTARNGIGKAEGSKGQAREW